MRAGVILAMVIATGASGAPSLPPCPDKPNCVSSQATDAHAIAPIRYASTRELAMARLLGVLRAMPRCTIVEAGPASVRAEFRTKIFRFVDDATFVFDDGTKTIHFRSASRVGHSDLGVNRRRMEEIRKAMQ